MGASRGIGATESEIGSLASCSRSALSGAEIAETSGSDGGRARADSGWADRRVKMQRLVGIAALLLLTVPASAQYGGTTNSPGLYGTGSNPNSHYVQPHENSNGTYTSGHYQTNPNNTQRDNYGTRGNTNPYTGAIGTRDPKY